MKKYLLILSSLFIASCASDEKFEELKNGHTPCEVRVEEVMSDRPRKFSGTENPNVYIGTYQSLEKWPKKFFEQFHTIATDEAHGAKAKTITSILGSDDFGIKNPSYVKPIPA